MILFRADGNTVIGSGHIMRCLSIAKQVMGIGQECQFVVADGTLCSFITQQGVPVHVLNSNYTQLDDEIEQLKELVSIISPSCVVVDSYYVTKEYLIALQKMVKIVYIDDIASFPYPVDCVVNYNIYGEVIDYDSLYQYSKHIPKFLLGTQFVPLRAEFQQLETDINVPEQVGDVFISTGGADNFHIALNLIQAILVNPQMKSFRFRFVIGSMSEDVDLIQHLANRMENVFVYQNVSNISQIMKSCQIAVSAAGSTLYELCACRIPTITYIIADNQILGAHTFKKLKIMECVGDIREVSNYTIDILNHIVLLANNHGLRVKMCEKMRKIIDGNGTKHIAEFLVNC